MHGINKQMGQTELHVWHIGSSIVARAFTDDDISRVNPLMTHSHAKYLPEWAEKAFDRGHERIDPFLHQVVELVLSHFSKLRQASRRKHTELL